MFLTAQLLTRRKSLYDEHWHFSTADPLFTSSPCLSEVMCFLGTAPRLWWRCASCRTRGWYIVRLDLSSAIRTWSHRHVPSRRTPEVGECIRWHTHTHTRTHTQHVHTYIQIPATASKGHCDRVQVAAQLSTILVCQQAGPSWAIARCVSSLLPSSQLSYPTLP